MQASIVDAVTPVLRRKGQCQRQSPCPGSDTCSLICINRVTTPMNVV